MLVIVAAMYTIKQALYLDTEESKHRYKHLPLVTVNKAPVHGEYEQQL